MKRKDLSPDKLQKASDALHYEFSMLKFLANILASDIDGKGVIHDALLESFLIHARVLIHFLYPSSPRDDDIIAQDFFTSLNEWKPIPEEKSTLLAETNYYANKLLAHLTYTRLKAHPCKTNWRFLKIATEIKEVLDVFLRTVPKELLGSRWKATRGAQGKDEQQ